MAGDKSAGKHRKATREARTQARRAKVMEYVLAGAAIRDIAKKLKTSSATVQRDKEAALAELSEQEQLAARDYRTIEDARLNAMLLPIWPDARQGDLEAQQMVMRIQERKGKLWGYDAIPKIELLVGEGMQAVLAELEVKLEPEVFQKVRLALASESLGAEQP